jgi:MoxR-like ATPase
VQNGNRSGRRLSEDYATQSALLEAMAEGRGSVDGQTYTLKPRFMVIATQNPIDHEGTFPLPEAQLDRFLIRLSLGYPIDDLNPVVPAADVLACQEAVRGVHVDDKVRRYVLEIVQGTRTHDDVALGGSPRASIALFRTAQAFAAINGRDFVLPDDVKRMVQPVLGHRLILRPESRLRKVTTAALLHEIVGDVRVPVPADKNAPADNFERERRQPR